MKKNIPAIRKKEKKQTRFQRKNVYSNGRRVLAARRAKGRKRLTISDARAKR